MFIKLTKDVLMIIYQYVHTDLYKNVIDQLITENGYDLLIYSIWRDGMSGDYHKINRCKKCHRKWTWTDIGGMYGNDGVCIACRTHGVGICPRSITKIFDT